MKILNVGNVREGDIEDLLSFCRERIQINKGAFLIPMNPIKIIRARSDPVFQRIIDESDWVFADAWGIKWAASFFYKKKLPLMPGYKVMFRLLAEAEKNGSSIYILGTTAGAIKKARIEMGRLYPCLRIVGSHHGFFSSLDQDIIFEEIAEIKPNFVFVAMGEHRQEMTIKKLRVAYDTAIYMGVGGSIDLLARKQPSPPAWIRENHLEWLFRLYCQPFRLPRFKALPQFVLLVIIEKIKMLLA